MARYFAGNSLAGFFRTSTAIVEDTTAGRFDSTYVSNSISVGAGASDYIESSTFSASGTVYIRFDCYLGSSNSNTNLGVTLMNGTTNVFRVGMASNTVFQCQFWNGSAWTNTGSTFAMSSASRQTVMAKVALNSSFELYINGTLIASGSGWSGGGTSVSSVRCYSICSSAAGTWYSQVMVADYDIRDAHLMSAAINGDSASNTSGTGAYTDVNETVLNESTALVLANAGKKGQTKASITVPSGLGIAAMVINARGRVSGGTITDGKLGIRSGGTNYSSSAKSYNGGYEPRSHIAESDPATGGAWTQTSFNNAEIYEEAA